MNNYDPKVIHSMSALLNLVATVVMVIAMIAGGLTGFVMYQFLYEGGLGGFAALFGFIYFGIIAGAGYVFALILRVIGQLMLAVTKIEINTRAGLDPHAAAIAQHEEAYAAVLDTDDAEVEDTDALEAATRAAMKARRE